MLERSGVTSPIDDLQFIEKLSRGQEYREALKGWGNSSFGKDTKYNNLFLCDVRTQEAKDLIGVLKLNRNRIGVGEVCFYYHRNGLLRNLPTNLHGLLEDANFKVLHTKEDFYARMNEVFGFPFLTERNGFQLSSSGVDLDYSVNFWRRNLDEWRFKPEAEIITEVSAEAFKRAFLQTFPSYRITPHPLT